MKNFQFILLNLLFINIQINLINSFVLPGKIDFKLSSKTGQDVFVVPTRGFYNQTKINLKLSCEENTVLKIGWLLRESPCIDEFYTGLNTTDKTFKDAFNDPSVNLMSDAQYVYFIKSDLKEYKCKDSFIELYTDVHLDVQQKSVTKNKPQTTKASKTDDSKKNENNDVLPNTLNQIKTTTGNNSTNSTDESVRKRRQNKADAAQTTTVAAASKHHHENYDTLTKTWADGAFLFILRTETVDKQDYDLNGIIWFEYKSGYLSANDWPFLPFYAVMCAIYIIYAIVWFTCSCCYFKDIIRVQFWIGGVIFLGMIEKAAYLAEYETVYQNGYAADVGLMAAEFVSCLKRSLARMLVIIVSLGFGIVKPRLGPTLQKVVAVGVLYFILAVVDGVFRMSNRKEDTDNKSFLASIPLAVLDVSICYWILTNLQQTMRTLRVRRNIAKLTLYRHFTNTLIFCVIASVIFMIWSLKRHRYVGYCLQDWKELWLDDAFWHILFSFILLVIIILWRPSNNSQRFMFTALLENEDEEGLIQDENQENEVFDSIKMRTKITNDTNKPKQQQKDKTIEDELKWVEEHVPASVTETALPGIIDSDEEVMTTKFEISKMD